MSTVLPQRAETTTRQVARRKRDLLLAGVIVVVIAALLLMLMQLVVLVVGSFRIGSLLLGDGFTVSHYGTIVRNPLFWEVTKNTFVVSLGTIFFMLLWSVPFAWLYARTDFRGNDMLLFVLTVRIAIPGFLAALAYRFLFNPTSGLVNVWLTGTFDLSSAPFNVYSLGWIAFLQGSTLASPAFFMMVPTFRAIDSSLEEAAAVSGVRRLTALRRILLPLSLPVIVATSIYYFVVAMEMFDYAAILGMPRRILVMSTWIYQLINVQDGRPRYSEASVVGVLFTLIAIALVFVYFYATRRADRFVVVTGKRGAQRTVHLGPRGRRLAWVGVIAFGLIEVIIPTLMLLWASLFPYLRPPSLAALSDASLSSYRIAMQELPPLLWNTAIVAVTVPTISVALALGLSWVVVRTRVPGRKAIEFVLMAAVGMPAIVGALAFLYFGLSIFRWVPIYTTVWIIVIAMATRYITWATRSLNSAFFQLHRELEESASVAGLRRGRAFVSIVAPIVWPAIAFSWFWIMLLSLRELTIPILLARRSTNVIATAIYGFDAAGSSNIAAALGVLLLMIIVVIVLVGRRLLNSRRI